MKKLLFILPFIVSGLIFTGCQSLAADLEEGVNDVLFNIGLIEEEDVGPVRVPTLKENQRLLENGLIEEYDLADDIYKIFSNDLDNNYYYNCYEAPNGDSYGISAYIYNGYFNLVTRYKAAGMLSLKGVKFINMDTNERLYIEADKRNSEILNKTRNVTVTETANTTLTPDQVFELKNMMEADFVKFYFDGTDNRTEIYGVTKTVQNEILKIINTWEKMEDNKTVEL